jgi:hypothetical protein
MLGRLFDAFGERSDTAVRRAVIAIALLSIVLTQLRHFAGIIQLIPLTPPDEVGRYEQRLARLKPALPQRGIVGFATDAPRTSEKWKRRGLASYILAPVLVVNSTEWPLVIGDFSDPENAKRVLGPEFEVRRDFGDGILLLARRE